MSWTPPRERLCGLSLETAECYGKPHAMARYSGSSVKSHRPEDGAFCAACGRRAGSVHHCPPLSRGRVFLLRTEVGSFALRPSLIALCGSGTTGCHGRLHSGGLKARWVWDTDEDARRWWSGDFLRSMEPHSPALYAHGRWVFTDGDGNEREWRGR